MSFEQEYTIEVFEMLPSDVCTETVLHLQPTVYRLRHRDGTYVRIGLDRYPRRGAEKPEASVWRDRRTAQAFNLWWGVPFTLEEGL